MIVLQATRFGYFIGWFYQDIPATSIELEQGVFAKVFFSCSADSCNDISNIYIYTLYLLLYIIIYTHQWHHGSRMITGEAKTAASIFRVLRWTMGRELHPCALHRHQDREMREVDEYWMNIRMNRRITRSPWITWKGFSCVLWVSVSPSSNLDYCWRLKPFPVHWDQTLIFCKVHHPDSAIVPAFQEHWESKTAETNEFQSENQARGTGWSVCIWHDPLVVFVICVCEMSVCVMSDR